MHVEFTIDILSLMIGIIFGSFITFLVWVSVEEQTLNKHRYNIGWHEGWNQGWDSHKNYTEEKETEV